MRFPKLGDQGQSIPGKGWNWNEGPEAGKGLVKDGKGKKKHKEKNSPEG